MSYYKKQSFATMKKQAIYWVLWLVSLFLMPARAARIDTLTVQSQGMKRGIDMIVIAPDQSLGNTPTHCPVIYLLHGFGNNHFAWLQIKPNLPQIADRKGLIFVCPDGQESWYWDSPQCPDSRYETFISQEMIAYVDAHYATIADRTGRAIMGLSMGGHGALWNAIRHKEVFGAAGSTSGGVDIRPFPNSWNMSKQLGDKESNPEVWEQHTVINQVNRLQNHDLALIIDCGEEDFFLEVNKAFHQKLLEQGIEHDFITRPGSHNKTYWHNSIDYQILFFEKFFQKIP